MSGMVPYRQPQSGMNYAQLMQMLQMKQMMDAQQGQQQQRAPSSSGLSDLLSSFGGGAAASSMMGGGGAGAVPTTQLADILSMGQTMPSVGPTVGNAAALPATSSLASIGVPAAAITAGILGGRSALNMLKGKQKNWKDASLADNAGRATLGIATGGLSEVANKMFGGHKSTKQRQSERWQGLAKDGKVPDWFLQQEVTQDQGVDDNKLASGKLGGRDVWATSGMFDTFGKDWATTGDENKREQVAKLMLDNKLFDSRKGVTNVTDKNKAMDIYNQVMGGNSGAAKSSTFTDPKVLWQKLPAQVKGAAPLPTMNDISNLQPVRKDSPGFKDGKRIDYSRR